MISPTNKMTTRVVAIVVLLVTFTSARAEPVSSTHLSENASPAASIGLATASMYAFSWKKDLLVLGTEALGAAGAFALQNSLHSLSPQDVAVLSRSSINRFDRGATYHYSASIDRASDVLAALPIAAPLVLLSDGKIRGSWRSFSSMYGETLLASYVVPTFTKSIFQRTRPFVYNPDAPLDKKLAPDARVSFFSQHTTFTFATSCFLSTVYGDFYPESKWKFLVWAGSLACAAADGYLRYEAGAHFPTDILTGAVVGTAIGCGVPLMHTLKGKNPTHCSINLFGLPVTE